VEPRVISSLDYVKTHNQGTFLFTRTTSQSPRLRETLATAAITRGNSRSVFSLVCASDKTETVFTQETENAVLQATARVRFSLRKSSCKISRLHEIFPREKGE
jgi:hypothetical protein